MRKRILWILALVMIVAAVFGACAPPEPITTALGEFYYQQVFTPEMDEETAAQGNAFMVLYLTPAEGTEVTIDQAQDYFFGGTKAEISGETYDMAFIAFEKVNGEYIRFGLVFEIIDYDYENVKEQPVVRLMLP